jgi:hypothetical protein
MLVSSPLQENTSNIGPGAKVRENRSLRICFLSYRFIIIIVTLTITNMKQIKLYVKHMISQLESINELFPDDDETEIDAEFIVDSYLQSWKLVKSSHTRIKKHKQQIEKKKTTEKQIHDVLYA